MNATKQLITRTKVIAAFATTLMSTAAISSAALADRCSEFLVALVFSVCYVLTFRYRPGS